jgi:DNA-binding response OmpR family regulator
MAKILVIEDSAIMRETIKQILRLDRYIILEAEDGPTGIAMARSEYPDLILLDLMMPYMPGDQVARYLQGDERLAAIPIIILTAMNRTDMIFNMLELNVRDYLLKPVEAATLRQRVRAVLNQKPSRQIPGSTPGKMLPF